MLGWVVRIVMALAGAVTGWFVAQDATNFGVVQMAIALFLITIFVVVAAFWPVIASWLKSSRRL